MTLIEYFKRFWEMDEREHFTPAETRLYFVLLRRFNKLYFPDTISIKESEIAAETCITVRSMHVARDSLVQRGLIGYVPGGSGRASACRWILHEKVEIGSHFRSPKTHTKNGLSSTLDSLSCIPKADLGSLKRPPNSALIGTRNKDNIIDKDNIEEEAVHAGKNLSPHEVNIFIRGNPIQKEQISMSVHRVTGMLLSDKDIDRWLDEFETFLGATMRAFVNYSEASYNFLTWLTKQMQYEQQKNNRKRAYDDRECAKEKRDRELDGFIAEASGSDWSSQGMSGEVEQLQQAAGDIQPHQAEGILP